MEGKDPNSTSPSTFGGGGGGGEDVSVPILFKKKKKKQQNASTSFTPLKSMEDDEEGEKGEEEEEGTGSAVIFRSNTPTTTSKSTNRSRGRGVALAGGDVSKSGKLGRRDVGDGSLLDLDFSDPSLDPSPLGSISEVDLDEDGIPTEEFIRSAKERRIREKIRSAKNGGGAMEEGGREEEDFIRLDQDRGGRGRLDVGPHPDSRIVREEDEIGSGEEDHSEFTGATERISLVGGKRGKEMEKERRLKEIQDAIRGVGRGSAGMVGSRGSGVEGNQDDQEMRERVLEEGEEEEEEEEWERSQMSKMESLPGHRQRLENRERSPYRSADIPLTSPMPTLTSSSSRLKNKLKSLEQSSLSHQAIMEDAERGLEDLGKASEENKAEVGTAEEKESWFREFEGFVQSLAGFLDSKVPLLEEAERESLDILRMRNRILIRARSKVLETELTSIVGGGRLRKPDLPSSLVPFVGGEEEEEEEEEVVAMEVDEASGFGSSNGDERRADQLDHLSAPDQISYDQARQSLREKVSRILSDVKAPEYLDPCFRISGREEDPVLHPSCIVSRFKEWRTRYREEYEKAWGGLALVSVWEFWSRLEICEWDPFPSSSPSASSANASNASSATTTTMGLEGFKWYKDLDLYVHSDVYGQLEEGNTSQVGGDDEILKTMISNVLLPRLNEISEKVGLDPWNRIDNSGLARIVEMASYFLDKGDQRLESLVWSFVSNFRSQIRILCSSLEGIEQAASWSSATSSNRLLNMLSTLLSNLSEWIKIIGSVRDGVEKGHLRDSIELLTKNFLSPLLRDLDSDVEDHVRIRNKIVSLVRE
ncbi:hypothetical protein IE53DRAFT_411810, partial [Violaceomyces palustris]